VLAGAVRPNQPLEGGDEDEALVTSQHT